MKLFGRAITSPVTLLPLDAFQRHLLSGLSGLLVWFIASAWPVLGPLRSLDTVWKWTSPLDSVWQWTSPMSLLNGLADHLGRSSLNLMLTLRDSNRSQSGEWITVVASLLTQAVNLLAPIIGVALLAASVVMLLGAFKIMTYPSRLQRFAPTVLGIVIVTIIAIQVVMPLFTHINDVVFPEDYYKPFIEFDVIRWVSKIVEIVISLIAPISVLLLSLVPIFAPVKKNSKAE
jgi:hypothetical protein